jgi:hypothetical protein
VLDASGARGGRVSRSLWRGLACAPPFGPPDGAIRRRRRGGRVQFRGSRNGGRSQGGTILGRERQTVWRMVASWLMEARRTRATVSLRAVRVAPDRSAGGVRLGFGRLRLGRGDGETGSGRLGPTILVRVEADFRTGLELAATRTLKIVRLLVMPRTSRWRAPPAGTAVPRATGTVQAVLFLPTPKGMAPPVKGRRVPRTERATRLPIGRKILRQMTGRGLVLWLRRWFFRGTGRGSPVDGKGGLSDDAVEGPSVGLGEGPAEAAGDDGSLADSAADLAGADALDGGDVATERQVIPPRP